MRALPILSQQSNLRSNRSGASWRNRWGRRGRADLGSLAPFERDPRKWFRLDWHDEYTKKPSRITTGERLHPSMSSAQSMRDVVREYGEHPEAHGGPRIDFSASSARDC